MLKFLIILFVIGYLFYKVGGFFFRVLSGFGGADQQSYQQHRRQEQYNQQKKKPSGGNVNIDYMPDSQKKNRSSKNFKGGEYVDYEEIK